MSKGNQLDSNCITDLVAVISQLSSFISSALIYFSLSFNYTILYDFITFKYQFQKTVHILF